MIPKVKQGERLSAQDRSFLLFESPSTPMNVGGPAIYKSGPLAVGRGVDFERIKEHVASKLHLIPRFRQRLAWIPIEDAPVWIDDERFNLNYHVRHVALPHPGDERQLKRLTADILSRPLDRQRPLWELWVVEGLPGGRFAIVSKTHHCMIDGASGVDVASATLSLTPDTKLEEPPPWKPRRPPSGVELLRDDLLRRATLPLELARSAAKAPSGFLRSDLGARLTAVWESLGSGLQPAVDTPFNQPIGGYRRFDFVSIDFAAAKRIERRVGCTINDVVLATVTGVLRRFFKRRRVPLGDLNIRAAVPVSVRSDDERGTLGNRVSVWICELPLAERKAAKRLELIREMTAALKERRRSLGVESLMAIAEWAGPLLSIGTRLAGSRAPHNLIVTNVPGSPVPFYMLGAKLLTAYPQVPLFENQGLGIALFSYAGKICWGFNADWDLVPDLHVMVEDVAECFAELEKDTAPAPARARRRAVGG